ncbi:MAG: hypothetical protein NUV52_01325 [Candidatus Roizmanbacteria bacterium]|nr:hypothetical protein [Candidatus Roizmanbacteria bacterium]
MSDVGKEAVGAEVIKSVPPGYLRFLQAYGPIIGACKHAEIDLNRVISHDIGNHITGVVGGVNASFDRDEMPDIPPVNLLIQSKDTVFDDKLASRISRARKGLQADSRVRDSLDSVSIPPEALDFVYRPDTLEAFQAMYGMLTDINIDSYEKMKRVKLPLNEMLAYFGVPLTEGARATLPDGFSSFALLNFLGNAQEHGVNGELEFDMKTNKGGTHYRVSNMSETPWSNEFLDPGIKGPESKGNGMGVALGIMFAQAGGYDLRVPAEGTKNIEFILSKK